jgi:hypothetical protein
MAYTFSQRSTRPGKTTVTQSYCDIVDIVDIVEAPAMTSRPRGIFPETVALLSLIARSQEDSLSINPVDDDNGSFFLVNDEEQHRWWPKTLRDGLAQGFR